MVVRRQKSPRYNKLLSLFSFLTKGEGQGQMEIRMEKEKRLF